MGAAWTRRYGCHRPPDRGRLIRGKEANREDTSFNIKPCQSAARRCGVSLPVEECFGKMFWKIAKSAPKLENLVVKSDPDFPEN